MSKCNICSKHYDSQHVKSEAASSKSIDNCLSLTAIKHYNDAPLGPLDPLHTALQRIRELELELARAKLAQVEAECKNQDLNHQLSTTITEMHTNRNSWQPWLSKTLNTLQEKVATRTGREAQATFQSFMSSAGSETNSPSGHQVS